MDRANLEQQRSKGARDRAVLAACIGAGAVIVAALIAGAFTLASRPLGADHSPTATFQETTGGLAHTWADYTTGGGTEGPPIGAHATVEVACRIAGLPVPNDNNPWWYQLTSAPWKGNFYVSADAFYNDGRVRGSLMGTPPVDKRVRLCG
jgi:hypothetical protein